MNLKKFEARTMKEALEMVKSQLGPDAIILSAKEVNKGFGLGGVKSIEITAAYSEIVLKQKKYAESKMPEKTREKFNLISAKNQKDVIKKVIQTQNDRILKNNSAHINSSPISKVQKTSSSENTGRRYIDIDSENLPRHSPASIATVSNNQQTQNVLTEQARSAWNNMDMQKLKNEIESLREIVSSFKEMPQSFVQSHPGAEFGINYSLCQTYQKLLDKGFLPQSAADIIMFVQQNISPIDIKNQRKIDLLIAQGLEQKIQIQSEVNAQFQLFYGPSGAGKTTSLVKLAAHLSKVEQKRVAIVSTDTIKVGADEQMKVYAQLLQIPFVSIKSGDDWLKIKPYLNQLDYVLVDYASMSLRNQDEIDYLNYLAPLSGVVSQNHLVLSAKMKDSDVLAFVERYKSIQINDYIVTCLDEAQSYGTICNLALLTDKPLFGFGIGRKIPEDFEFSTIERIIDLILEITKSSEAQKNNTTNNYKVESSL